MSRRWLLRIIVTAIIIVAVLRVVSELNSVPPDRANDVLMQERDTFLIAGGLCILVLMLGNAEGLTKATSRWMATASKSPFFLSWFFFFILVFSGLLTSHYMADLCETLLNGALKLPGNETQRRMFQSPFPSSLLYVFLQILEMVYVLLFCGPARTTCALVVAIHRFANMNPIGLVLAQVLLAFLIAVPFRWTIWPVLRLTITYLGPSAMVAVHDVSIAIPNDAPARLDKEGRLVIRVRRKASLLISIIAGFLAAMMYMFWT